MEDFGEYTPLDSHYANGMDGTRMHNLYPTQYHCAAYDFARAQKRPVIRFQRSGFTGVAPCAQVVWSGDPTVGWDFDGLSSQIKAAVSIGMSGISTWGSDIGGFFALGTRELTPELLMRWVQFGAASPVMRMQRNGVAFPEKERPQVEDDDQIDNWRRYAKLHTRLLPYLEAADRVYRRKGLPIMRYLALMYPDDERSYQREDEYLFGPDLLAAPVIEPGATERDLYLPPGRWVDFWRSVSYREQSGGLRVRRAHLLGGRREATVPAPLDELPLMMRAGSVLPLLPADVDTLASYGPGKDAISFRERRKRLDLIAFPRGHWKGTFFNGEKLRSDVRGKHWTLVIRGKRKRRYRLQAALPFETCSGSRIVRRSFRMRRGRIRVRACR
jgi:alpha-glucosidase (family GH31 glycosyl hydrolase)